VSTRNNEFDYRSDEVPDTALFVVADEPLLVFPSVAAAQQYLEAVDVQDGVYPAAYGPTGKPYRVGTRGRQVVIEPTGETEKPDELRTLLVQYLHRRIIREADVHVSLEALVEDVWKIESSFWQEHDPYGDRFGSRIPAWGCLAFLLAVATILYLVLGNPACPQSTHCGHP
jgi:hypothetical protein